MLTILIGKTASGKDTITNKLLVEHGYKKIVTTTTRPPRDNEINGITYDFISNDEFEKLINEDYFVEYKSYNTAHGKWYYGLPVYKIEKLKDDEDYIIIMTPQGVTDYLKKFPNKDEKDRPIVIYIYSNNSTIQERLTLRGDDKDEIKRRICSDNNDFRNAYDISDRIFYNFLAQDICSITNEINEYIQNRKKQRNEKDKS